MIAETAASPVAAASIERELRELWEAMAGGKAGEPGSDRPVLRACVQNLIVVAPGPRAGIEVGAILAEVSERHPSRMLVLLPRPDRSELHTSAHVTALCHLAGKSKQVCCEQIVIEAGAKGLRHLSSLVQPLLVPDLPVVLWWRDRPPASDALFHDLRAAADRLILDSSTMADAARELPELARSLGGARWTRTSDLAWAALTPWRALMAGFFDVPAHRSELARLDRVEVDALAPHGADLPVQPLLLAGWLASRLGWRRLGPLKRGPDGAARAAFEGPRRGIELAVRIKVLDAPQRDRIEAIRLVCSEGPACFSLRRSEDRGHLEAGAELAGLGQCGRVVRIEEAGEAELLSHELELLRGDRVYEAAVRVWED
jgi:glucose-6-phosphate dehydrogenase assembly protein OpcA